MEIFSQYNINGEYYNKSYFIYSSSNTKMAAVNHFSLNHLITEDPTKWSVYFFKTRTYLYGLIIVVHVIESS